jgi:hypothetical protein
MLVSLLLPASLLFLSSNNNPATSAVDTGPAVADIIPAVRFSRVPAVLMVSAIAGVHAAVVVLNAVKSQEQLLWLKSVLLPPSLTVYIYKNIL